MLKLSKFIFKDESRLSPYYIPINLPHRDEQIRFLTSIYGRTLENIKNTYPRFTQIIGRTGSGKTCTTIRFGELLTKWSKTKSIDLKHVYLNCKIDGTTLYVLFGNLVKKVVPELSTRSLSSEDMLHQLVDYLRQENKYLIITFDEIDYFVKTNPKEHIVYNLTRIPEIYPGEPSQIIGEIFISRSLDWHETLEPEEKSSLGNCILKFPRYSEDQIRNVLEERILEALEPNTIEEESLSLICDITASSPVNGDIRVALDILYYSGILAENLGAEKIFPNHVRKVYSETNPTITTEDIISLDEKSKVILLAIIRALQNTNLAYVGLRELRENTMILCEELNIKPINKFEDYVQDLIYRGIIDMKSLTELGISGASLIDLEIFLKKLVHRLG